MKLSTIVLVALQTTSSIAAPADPKDPAAIAECGEFGVIDWSQVDIPEKVDREKLRKCNDHPQVSPNRQERSILEKRDCWWGETFGCSMNPVGNYGYCWMSCDYYEADGTWCWMADEYGWGSWTTCFNKWECVNALFDYRQANCGLGCIGPNNYCGCDCRTKKGND